MPHFLSLSFSLSFSDPATSFFDRERVRTDGSSSPVRRSRGVALPTLSLSFFRALPPPPFSKENSLEGSARLTNDDSR